MNKEFNCPVEATISLIGGKYKSVILFHLMGKTLRYSELHKKIPKATDKIDIVNIGLHFFHKDVRLYAASCSEV